MVDEFIPWKRSKVVGGYERWGPFHVSCLVQPEILSSPYLASANRSLKVSPKGGQVNGLKSIIFLSTVCDLFDQLLID